MLPFFYGYPSELTCYAFNQRFEFETLLLLPILEAKSSCTTQCHTNPKIMT
jgi:hypothetical protein